MWQVVQTDAFMAWLSGLNDDHAVARIVARVRRLELGNLGDAKSVGAGVSEMRIDYGPGSQPRNEWQKRLDHAPEDNKV
jgi:putative addiction module killer protein